MWVKGSGGDLGTLTEAGLAVLRLDRLRALVDVYPGVDREDEMVAAFDFCGHGKGGAAPSIDTAMHGLVDRAARRPPPSRLRHRHRHRGRRRAADAKIFGDKVVWVPWRRPGFQLGLDIAAIQTQHPEAVGVILGGHGITAWGETSDECERNSLWIIDTAAEYIATPRQARAVRRRCSTTTRRCPRPSGGPRLPRWRRRSGASPRTTSRWSATSPTTRPCSTSSPREHPRLAALGTSCPDHFLRTKVKPMLLDLPADGAGRRVHRPAAGAACRVPRGLPRLLRAHAERRLTRHARRRPAHRARPRRRHVQLRTRQADRARRRRVLHQRDQRDARRRGAVHVPADQRRREVPHRVLGARGSQAAADA